jgi:S1-C subfamily serine protease
MALTDSPAPSIAAFSAQLADIVEQTGASVVAVLARRSYPSSGLLWQPGVVLTAAHTIRRETDIAAVLPDGSRTPATLAGVDSGTDVAVLRLESAHGTPAPLDETTSVRPGHYVVAVARDAEGTLTASSGIVGRTGGEWRTWRGGRMNRLIQLDGGLWPGFSGAPIVNANGRIIGIGTSTFARGRAVVIPVPVLRRTGEQLLAHGRIAQAWLGAGMQSVEIPARIRERLGLEHTHGLIVVSVASHGPAEKSGVTLGDVLVALDTSQTPDIESLRSALAEKSIGAPVKLKLIRGGELQRLEVTLEARPHAR